MLETSTKDCRHGVFTFYTKDRYVGKSLDLYGDYSEDECYFFKKVLLPDDIAIEIGANIGSLTVPMAKLCKRVHAFEPQIDNFLLLSKNVLANDLCGKIIPYNLALGATDHVTKIPSLEKLGHDNFGCIELGEGDSIVRVIKLDDYGIDDKIKLIKIDAEGMEREILQGAEEIIRKHQPFLYVENDRVEKSADLVGWLIDHHYRCFKHVSPYFIDQNFRGEKINVFGNTSSFNLICIPESRGYISVHRLEEVDDHRVDIEMYQREITRALKRVEKSEGIDLESRVIAAHYTNLMNDEAGARRLLDENLSVKPRDLGTLAVKALIDLQSGNFKEGWQGYELRYQHIAPDKFGFRPHAEPHWDGSPTDERVLIWCEQGFGDTIMFCRFMEEVLKRAPNAILEVQPQVFELLETSKIMPEGQLFRLGRTMPKYAYHCSLPSVPSVLRLEREDQVRRGKYLFGDTDMIAGWKKRSTPRIGVCLKGGVYSERAYSRDMPREWGDKLADEFGPFMSLGHEGQWESYADTAAAIEALDLVLSVDTSVVHLAGALGVPTYLMLSSDPDWRWQRGRSDSPWYPSLTIFRQKQFLDWSTVVDEIAQTMRMQGLKAA